MKKTGKLKLNAETVRNLDASQLRQAAGGLPMTDGCGDSGGGETDYCPTNTCTAFCNVSNTCGRRTGYNSQNQWNDC